MMKNEELDKLTILLETDQGIAFPRVVPRVSS